MALYYNNRNLIQLNTTVTVGLGNLGKKLWNFGEKNYDTILKTIELCFTMEKLCCNEKICLLYFFLLGQLQCINNICCYISTFGFTFFYD